MLSQYYKERYALDLIGERAEGVGLDPAQSEHQRVLAVLAYLRDVQQRHRGA